MKKEENNKEKNVMEDMEDTVNGMYDMFDIALGKTIEITETEKNIGFDDYNKSRQFVDLWIKAVKSGAIDPRYSASFFEGYTLSFIAAILMQDDPLFIIIDKMQRTIRNANK